ncbi:MAG: hypothetical protein KJ914_01205 [Gammaproteobacteria bacterium]|nr:hypothetical protein [Gammaproteobacteria bacterium]MBU1722926.1 hypothetical protein [Gammaproteobacteria bacterium]MBU2005697.1 hypothetical protein [Gammaproteobacteria bacterium]
MDKGIFFNIVRNYPFPDKLTAGQVKGMDHILDEWLRRGLTDLRWLAYMLATTFHETAYSMEPIREFGQGQGKEYGTTHYGRGFVQLTWKNNYQKMGDLLGIDLVNNPDKALEWGIATKVMFEGMINGLFTGVGLPKYFAGEESDWRNARKIINGLDRADNIAHYARAFYVALYKAQNANQDPRALEQQVMEEPSDSEIREIFREFQGTHVL